MPEKNLQLERTVFFCDAIVAIAITLLALNIRIDVAPDAHLQFSDIISQWKTFLAFFLSFFNIANFWKAHHSFFVYIKKVDEKMLWFNILWLFFIVLLPFSTSLVSAHFHDVPAMFLYSLNILLIASLQNTIWDYAALHPDYIKENEIEKETVSRIGLYCNLDMINGLLAVGISFLSPGVAFVILLTKLPMLIIARLFYGIKKDGTKLPKTRDNNFRQ